MHKRFLFCAAVFSLAFVSPLHAENKVYTITKNADGEIIDFREKVPVKAKAPTLSDSEYAIYMNEKGVIPLFGGTRKVYAFIVDKQTHVIKRVDILDQQAHSSELLIKAEKNAKMIADLNVSHSKVSNNAPKKTKKKAYVAEFPASVDGMYVVWQNGGVSRLSNRGGLLYDVVVERLSPFDVDAGLYKGYVDARMSYNDISGIFFIRSKVLHQEKLHSAFRRCGTMFSPYTDYRLQPVLKPNGEKVKDAWKLALHEGDRKCLIHNFSAKTCKATSCAKYDNRKQVHVVTKDRATATKIAAQNEKYHKNPLSYKQLDAEIRRSNSKRNSGAGYSSDKGYFERGGACGAVSCDEANTNQFIIDEVWGR